MKNRINNTQIIIDERMRKIEKEKLEELGYNLIELKPSSKVYGEISSHVDIFMCKIKNKLIVEPSTYLSIKEKASEKDIIVEIGKQCIKGKYPDDIKYNVAILGKKAIHNFKYTDTKVKEELQKQGYELINTTQGYTNCSIAIIDNESAIVTDKGLYKILQKHNIDVLYLESQPDIKLLENNKYSNKKGFIGGAISKIENNIIVFGDLDKIDSNNKIREFIKSKGLNIIDFKGLDIIDYGGVVLLK